MKKQTCSTTGCKRPKRARGLCATCYRAALRMIERGEATELELVKQGRLEPIRSRRGLFRRQAK